MNEGVFMIEIRYEKIYNQFIENYKEIHVNPWHEISEEELRKIYDTLLSSMDVNNEYSFKYFMDYIIKRLNGTTDAHTKYEAISAIPMNFRVFGGEILINYPEDLKNSKLIAINEISMDRIIHELEDVISYGTPGKRRYEIEKSLFNKLVLFGLPSLRNVDTLIFTIQKIDGSIIKKEFARSKNYFEELFDYDKYRYGNNATYRFIDNCLVYNHSSVQSKFKEKIEQAIELLKKEDLSNIDTIIVDLRGNTGGNAALNQILMEFLKENKDKQLLCLTDYRVFSGGRYALRDLINLGAITIGEEISTPINCYGNSHWFTIAQHNFSVSECYFHPFAGWSASSKEEFQSEVTKELYAPYIFTPDILINETKEDYMKNSDVILNYALEYSRKLARK